MTCFTHVPTNRSVTTAIIPTAAILPVNRASIILSAVQDTTTLAMESVTATEFHGWSGGAVMGLPLRPWDFRWRVV
ncbi:MAG: hypothetical protein LBK25_01895 [Treponema sp.]|nr:hypothetical protein [Treponema sp.]